jgi:hypothetical protein
MYCHIVTDDGGSRKRGSSSDYGVSFDIPINVPQALTSTCWSTGWCGKLKAMLHTSSYTFWNEAVLVPQGTLTTHTPPPPIMVHPASGP